MEPWLELVHAAKGEQLRQMLEDVLDRYAELYPEWEVRTVSLERSHSRREQIERMIELLQGLKSE